MMIERLLANLLYLQINKTSLSLVGVCKTTFILRGWLELRKTVFENNIAAGQGCSLKLHFTAKPTNGCAGFGFQTEPYYVARL